MRWRKIALLALPTALAGLLVQSYLWVPTFPDQARGDPRRLVRFVNATVGDASILNPVLASDTVSGEVNDLVFDGLIDRGPDLAFRGRLAESWRLFEEAYVLADPAVALGDGTPGSPEGLRRRIEPAARQGLLGPLEGLAILPAGVEPVPGLAATVRWPARLRLTLGRVDPDLIARLDRLLGGYVGRLDPARYVEGSPEARARARELAPAVEENPVIEFRLRPGVRFHDGRELDAEDVRFTYEALVDPRTLSPRAPDFEPVKAVTVTDRLGVRIVYKRLFQPGLESWTMGILPRHRYGPAALAAEARAAGRDPARYTLRDARANRAPIGTGPFRFVEWRTDEVLRLARWDSYWEGQPRLQEYLLRVLPDRMTEELTLYAGTTDQYEAEPHQVTRLRGDGRFQTFSAPGLRYTYIGYNLRRPPFQDVRVRRALGLALDVDQIIRHVLDGQGDRTTGPLPRPTDFYDPTVPALPHDPAEALRLLAEAGYRKNATGWLERDGRPLAFTLVTNHGNETRRAILTIAQHAWRRLGIQVEALSLEWAVFIKERINKLDFDAVVLGWTTPLDPDLYQVFHSSQTGPFQLNFVGYRNPRVDELAVRIRREYDHATQVALARELHRTVAADQPYTFLFVPRVTTVLDRKLVRWVGEEAGAPRYAPIVPDRVGNLRHDVPRWTKLAGPGGRPALAPN